MCIFRNSGNAGRDWAIEADGYRETSAGDRETRRGNLVSAGRSKFYLIRVIVVVRRNISMVSWFGLVGQAPRISENWISHIPTANNNNNDGVG